MSRTGSHPRRPNSLCSLSLLRKLLKNAPLAAFFTDAISRTPRTATRARGQRPENPTADAREAQAKGSEVVTAEACASRGRRRFSGHQSRHQRGMRRRPGNERRPKAALLSACGSVTVQRSTEAPVSVLREGASAARTAEHPENRRRTPAGDRRPAMRNNCNCFRSLLPVEKVIKCAQAPVVSASRRDAAHPPTTGAHAPTTLMSIRQSISAQERKN